MQPIKHALSIARWRRVEGTAGTIQFGLFGLILGVIQTRFSRPSDASLPEAPHGL